MIIVCNAKSGGVEVLEVDESDHKVWDGYVDGQLVAGWRYGTAIAPNGDLAFFVGVAPSAGASLVRVAPEGNAVELGGPVLVSPGLRAIAADGTLLVSTKDGLSAISNRAVSWQTPLAASARVFVDAEHTIVAADNDDVTGIDLASGAKMWVLPLPHGDIVEIASAGPGKVYVLTSSSLTLISD